MPFLLVLSWGGSVYDFFIIPLKPVRHLNLLEFKMFTIWLNIPPVVKIYYRFIGLSCCNFIEVIYFLWFKQGKFVHVNKCQRVYSFYKGNKIWISLFINPYLPSRLFHQESISNFRGVWCTFSFLFLIEIHVSKQRRPWSGSTRFVYVPLRGRWECDRHHK